MSAVIWYGYKVTMPEVHAKLPEWWRERICDCPEFGHTEQSMQEVISDKHGPWRNAQREFPEPSSCTNCGKWSRSHLRICDNCRQYYYHFFRHSGSGIFGTSYCWACCQAGKNAGTWRGDIPAAAKRTFNMLFVRLPYARPPRMVVPDRPSVDMSIFDFEI